MNFKHGGKGSRLYTIWIDMKDRCLNSRSTSYKNYGGRGITICPEWTESYTEFRDWALNNDYQDNLTIDRIENNGNYKPNNCRWVTKVEQNRNQRKVILTLEKANEIRSLYNTGNYTQQELAKLFGIIQTIVSRIILNQIWKN